MSVPQFVSFRYLLLRSHGTVCINLIRSACWFRVGELIFWDAIVLILVFIVLAEVVLARTGREGLDVSVWFFVLCNFARYLICTDRKRLLILANNISPELLNSGGH